MLLNIKINKETLEVFVDDTQVVINDIKQDDQFITLEIGKPEQEIEYPWQQ